MKTLGNTVAVMMLTAITGCSQGTPGGEGTTGEQPMMGQAEDTFNLSVPRMSSSLQQGENTIATVGIKRATNFDQDITLKFADLPKGVTVEPASPGIKRGETEAKITFTAADEAPVGDYKIKVAGHPAKGSDAHVEFKLTIAAKDSFVLTMPDVSPLMQGTTQTISIGITRDKKFDQDVALKFDEMPNGITLDPADPVIKQGQSAADVKITGADDAALGDFRVKVTGHPVKGADASSEITFTVVKK